MTTTARRIEQHTFRPDDALLFDANVWLSIYCPAEAKGRRARIYSGAIKKAQQAGSAIFVGVLVLSEFINRYARLEHHRAERSAGAPHNFKEYRRTQAFKAVAKAIADGCRRVLRSCRRTESGFESVDMGALLIEYEAGDADFNDQILAGICRTRGLTLVTHDADFGGSGLAILTANGRLLK